MSIFREISKKAQLIVKKLQISVSVSRYFNFASIILLENEIPDKIAQLQKHIY